MSITKRVAYLKGLTEGLELGRQTKEEKILAVVIDILEDIAVELEEVKGDVATLDDDIGQLCEDMQELEDALLLEEEAAEEAAMEAEEAEEADEAEEAEEADEADEPQFFELQCPSCHNEITIDEGMLALGSVSCPGCSETLEFDMEEE